MSERYGVQCGSDFKPEGRVHMTGPQKADQVPEGVRQLFATVPKLTHVILVHDDLNTIDNARGGYFRAYNTITKCTGVSANWCPVHGDCTCKDPDDKNDDDCPLHSMSSDHAESEAKDE